MLIAIGLGSFAATLRLTPVPLRELANAQAPSLVLPREALGRITMPAQVDIQFISTPDIDGPAGVEGIITDLNLVSGEPVKEGDLIIEVEGQWIGAMSGPFPLYRAMSWATSGDDVVVLQNFLVRQVDSDLEITGTVDGATVRAVKRYQESLGIRRPSGVATPQQFVWMGPELTNLVDPVVAVGDQLGPNVTLAAGTRSVSSTDAHMEGTPPLIAEPTRLSLNSDAGDRINLMLTLDGSLTLLDDVDLRLLPSVRAALKLEPRPDRVLIQGQATSIDTRPVLEVPPSALASASNGRDYCIWVGPVVGPFEPKAVQLISVTPNGTPQLEPFELPAAGVLILANPDAFLGDSVC